ncbi:MAG: type II/IV secretion system protein [Candidatus Moranbacteria bacterium]|jgi:type IV pilus assembly protein PilB|nr:type II/IV secretion system protein [Candidatus Moranbacteria bacterium]
MEETETQMTVPKVSDTSSGTVPVLSEFPKQLEKRILEIIPEATARKHRLFCFEKTDTLLRIAMVDPSDFDAMNMLRFLAEKESLSIEIYRTTETVFGEVMRNYSGTDKALQNAILSLKKGAESGIDLEAEKKKVVQGEIFQDAPIAKLVEVIVKHALDGRASDIHIEPIEGNYRVRFRIDGVLKSQLVFPLEVGRAVVSRIKILSNLKIDEKRKPQDGRIHFESGGRAVDLRVSSLPVMEGEKIVMRVLDRANNVSDFDVLGLLGRNRTVLLNKIREPFGIVLITGPTGSGKSTTLYAFLQILNQEERNIVTLEDPVEYFIDGVNQSQIRPEIGYTFSAGLRSILRQDPNIIMVGEIRDNETAELAIHAALTGHLVLSTLHTNDAIGSVPRLVDMGVESFLLASSLQSVAAQRLVRKICEKCKTEMKITDLQRNRLAQMYQEIPLAEKKAYNLKDNQEIKVFKGEGCDDCGRTGHKGRIGIYEVFEITDPVKSIITDHNANEHELRKESLGQGMISMKEDGILKVLLGLTTLAEVERATEGKLLIDEE